MEVGRHHNIKKDFKLLKRYLTAEESLKAWERLFSSKGLRETPGIEVYPGFGQERIYKARVVPLKEKCGKSKGYRVIFKIVDDICEILVFSRHGIYKSEKELISIIKTRLLD
ncbi:hypothetical protein A3B87_01125 [Candidatus Kuenenbacteria bacterium RIFCSPHIGHO2_02_FULL_39_13]|uniref:Addiction module toxin RelE n=1 Tax=Candidatus Kuenenbacteria bacterium RIFCSPHIGHO2_02_FULL_39_13 TaxID=1798561 RepID=A0A1F6FLL7_9BACT|nr:MAG: hypothetical protein A3B87_01125 [Candidatus Kuenenbacteria bacterium RIFCSPHIGHO2_02_FULL_39_13]